ncbi:hypothetical protein L917_12447, partial [Phytophthora nicotianae]
ARVECGKEMSEQALITLLNCKLRDLNCNEVSTREYIRQQWHDIWFTSHMFRWAGAHYRLCLLRLTDGSCYAWYSGGLGGSKTSKLRLLFTILLAKLLRMKIRHWRNG